MSDTLASEYSTDAERIVRAQRKISEESIKSIEKAIKTLRPIATKWINKENDNELVGLYQMMTSNAVKMAEKDLEKHKNLIIKINEIFSTMKEIKEPSLLDKVIDLAAYRKLN